MMSTYFVTTVYGATLVIAATGFCSAVSAWVPFSLLGEAISLESSSAHGKSSIPLRSRRQPPTHVRNSEDEELMFTAEDEFGHSEDTERKNDGDRSARQHYKSQSLGSNPDASISGVDVRMAFEDGSSAARSTSPEDEDEVNRRDERRDEEHGLLAQEGLAGDEEENGNTGDDEVGNRSGIILGIHNIFVVIPQFLVTGMSSIIFAIMEPPKVVPDQHDTDTTVRSAVAAVRQLMGRSEMMQARNVDSVGVILRVGSVSAAVASYLCWRLSRELLSNKASRR